MSHNSTLYQINTNTYSNTTTVKKLKPTIQVSCEPKLGLAQRSYLGDAQFLLMLGPIAT